MPFSIFLLGVMMVQPAGVTPQSQGTISASDPVAGAQHYDAWPVEFGRARPVAITVAPRGTSAPFTLSVHDAGSGRRLAEADGAALAFTAPADGTYMVRVESTGEGGYTLRIAASGDSGGEVSSAGPPARFILCPGHQRCPR